MQGFGYVLRFWSRMTSKLSGRMPAAAAAVAVAAVAVPAAGTSTRGSSIDDNSFVS